tara:strand:+ start:125 stop:922 length:798 start_codon:yes stop_codon:yes gene_type:complete
MGNFDEILYLESEYQMKKEGIMMDLIKHQKHNAGNIEESVKDRCFCCGEMNIWKLCFHHLRYNFTSVRYNNPNWHHHKYPSGKIGRKKFLNDKIAYHSALANEVLDRPHCFMILCNNCHDFIENWFTRETLGYDEARNAIGLNAEEIDEHYNLRFQQILDSRHSRKKQQEELVILLNQMNVVYLTLKAHYDLKIESLNVEGLAMELSVLQEPIVNADGEFVMMDPVDDLRSFEKIEHVWSLLQEMEQIVYNKKNTGQILEKIYKI